jgi:hypothetical protein
MSVLSHDALEKRVHVKVLGKVGPMHPILQADFLSLSQDPLGGVCPRSTEKTSELTVLCSRSMSQELSCGRGKSELNRVRKSESVRAKFPCTLVFLKDLLARSAMRLLIPDGDGPQVGGAVDNYPARKGMGELLANEGFGRAHFGGSRYC